MKRYQVYLNSDAVAVLDEFEQVTKLSRSKLIREAIDQLSNNLRLLLNQQQVSRRNPSALASLIGLVQSAAGKSTDLARHSDRHYLRD